MEQAQVIGGLLVIAHQDRPALGQPAQGAFYHPPAGGEGFLTPLVQLLLPNSPDMRTVPEGWQRSHDRWDCHTLCPGTSFGRLPGARLRCSPGSVSRVSYHGRWLQPPPRSGVRLLRRPGCSSCSQPCPGRWGCVQWRPPKTRFTHGAVRRLPFPVHSAQFLATLHQGRPDAPQHPTPHPTLEGPMDGAIVSQLPGQVVPLAAASHPKDNAFQHLPLVHPFAPPGFGRIQLQYHSIRSQRSSGTSQIVGNAFPSTTIHLHPSLGTILATTLTH